MSITKKNLKGGDGYAINVNEAIGGKPAFTRYSSNYSPVFLGELLQDGGKKSNKTCKNINIKNSDFNKTRANKEKGTYMYDIIKKFATNKTNNNQKGGNNQYINNTEKVTTQFNAIKEVSHNLEPSPINSIKKMITKLFFKNLQENKPMKNKQLGGYAGQLSRILAPLGKNNLLVIASLLLLHHFAVESKRLKSKKNIGKTKKTKKSMKGGNTFLGSMTKIMAPTGINNLGSVALLALLHGAFMESKLNKPKKPIKKTIMKVHKGGNFFINLIAPLGTNAFIATGLLVVIEQLINSRVKQLKTKDIKKKKMLGGKVNKKLNSLFNLVAPISFNAFTTKNKYDNITSKMAKMSV